MYQQENQGKLKTDENPKYERSIDGANAGRRIWRTAHVFEKRRRLISSPGADIRRLNWQHKVDGVFANSDVEQWTRLGAHVIQTNLKIDSKTKENPGQ
jgi:hypothetical protein